MPAIRTLADIEAIEAVPWTERFAHQTTTELLRASAAAHPDRPAIRYLPTPTAEPQDTSYAELWDNIRRTASLFRSLGVGRNDAVTYVLPNLPETHEVIWGAQLAGRAHAINPFLDAATIAALMRAVGSCVLVVATNVASFPDACALLDAVKDLRALRAVIVIGPMPGPLDNDWPPLHPLSAREPFGLEPDAFEPPAPDDVAAIFHTGGTTGRPKLAPHLHRNEAFMAQMAAFLVGAAPGDGYLVGLPLFHVNAAISSGLAVFAAGGTVVLATPMGFRTPGLITQTWRIVEEHRVTATAGVPTVYGALLDVPVGGRDLSSLRFAGCGAAPLSTELFRRFEAHTGVRLLEGYGLTEATVTSTLNPVDGERRVGSIGLRLPYQEVRIVELDKDKRVVRDCEDGEPGTLLLRGPNVFPGYLGRTGVDSGLLDDGWLDTGDLSRRDVDGYYWLTGRAKDIIIRGGHNIDAAQIEAALARHPAVREAAAFAQPDDHAGELPCAAVELRDGMSATPAELLAFARRHVGERAAVPVHIEIMDALPVTAVGKVYKPELRRLAAERVANKAG